MEVVKAKKELAEAMKKVEAVMEKASLNLVAKHAYLVVIFRVSKWFSNNCLVFSQEAFEKGYELGKQECHAQVANRHPCLDLAFLDEQEGSKGEPSNHGEVAMLAFMVKLL